MKIPKTKPMLIIVLSIGIVLLPFLLVIDFQNNLLTVMTIWFLMVVYFLMSRRKSDRNGKE